MHVKPDYETEDILAVFDDPETGTERGRRLREYLGDAHRVVVGPLEPGRYQMADTSLHEVVHGAMRASQVSVPLGALAGLGLGAAAIPGVGTSAPRETSHVIGLLVHAGARACLNPTVYYSTHPEPVPDAA